MLTITIKGKEVYDPRTKTFIQIKDTVLSLEHSLVSISKWEAQYHKPFISNTSKTTQETLDYIKHMTITQNVNPLVYLLLTKDDLHKINEYMGDSMTATWFHERKDVGKRNSEQITSELIYYWMVALQIPFECQKWHLNRLFTLIRICNIKNQPSKKYSKKETMSKNAALNAARRKNLGTSG